MAHTANRKAAFVAAVVALLFVGLGIVRVSEAGFSDTTTSPANGWSGGTVTLSDDATGTALFDTATDGLLDGGTRLERCITVTYTGSLTTNVGVRLHAATSGTLAPYLDTVITEGTGGGAGSCGGFTPGPPLFTGTLATLAAQHGTFSTGLGNWSVTATPQTKTFQIVTMVRNDPAAQNKTATAAFTWEARSGTPPSYAETVLADAPEAYWRLGDTGATFADSTGNNRHMTVPVNTGFGAPGIPGARGDTAWTTGGTSGSVPDAPWNSPTGSFAVETWLRWNGGGAEAYLVEKYDSPGRNGFILRMNGGRPIGYTQNSAGVSLITGPILAVGTWSHLVFSYDGPTQTGTLYVNGVQVATTPGMRLPTDGSATMKIGARGDDGLKAWVGDLDEVAFYRTTLSAARVAAHYAAGATAP